MREAKVLLGKEILRWHQVISPLSMFFCFLYSFFSLSWLLWFRLLRPFLPIYFSSLGFWWVAYLSLFFLSLFLGSLYFQGFLPWKARGNLLRRLRSSPWGTKVYFSFRRLTHSMNNSFTLVFMFFWEKINLEKTIFLFSLSTLLWPPSKNLPFFLSLLYFLLSFLPKIIVLFIFLGEAFFAQYFHFFYAWIFLLFIPWFYHSYLSFWEAWSVGWVKHLEGYYLRVEELEGSDYSFSPLLDLTPREFSRWISLWGMAMEVEGGLEEAREIRDRWNRFLHIFLFLGYFLGWSSILLRFFFWADFLPFPYLGFVDGCLIDESRWKAAPFPLHLPFSLCYLCLENSLVFS